MATFLFWVAFTHEGKSVGVCIVEADDYADPATVVQKTLDLGINPGRGEIQGAPRPPRRGRAREPS